MADIGDAIRIACEVLNETRNTVSNGQYQYHEQQYFARPSSTPGSTPATLTTPGPSTTYNTGPHNWPSRDRRSPRRRPTLTPTTPTGRGNRGIPMTTQTTPTLARSGRFQTLTFHDIESGASKRTNRSVKVSFDFYLQNLFVRVNHNRIINK